MSFSYNHCPAGSTAQAQAVTGETTWGMRLQTRGLLTHPRPQLEFSPSAGEGLLVVSMVKAFAWLQAAKGARQSCCDEQWQPHSLAMTDYRNPGLKGAALHIS